MAETFKKLHRSKLNAADGEIGRVNDFYFDDENWAVRYLVMDTGLWMSNRQILVSPYAVGPLGRGGKISRANVTRKKIEGCPSLALHKPVSRGYEEAYSEYYGWPCYWQGGSLWAEDGIPAAPEISKRPSAKNAASDGSRPADVKSPLWSAQSVMGYQIQARDEVIGHVVDFVIDEKSWAIRHLIINTGSRLRGNQVPVCRAQIDRIRRDESKVYINVSGEELQRTPPPADW
jgi:hypothetical protein